MMKARIENGVIRFYSNLPSKYTSDSLNIAGGFHLLPEEIHQEEGFFDVLFPQYDRDTETIGEVFFDEAGRVFTYTVIPLQLPAVEVLKTEKKQELKTAVKDLYQTVQWYVEMKRMNDEAIPALVTDKIKTVKTKYDQLKNHIDALTTAVDVVKFRLPYEAIETLKLQLESIE